LDVAIGEAQAVQNVIVRLCDLPGCAWLRPDCQRNRNGSLDVPAWRFSHATPLRQAFAVTRGPFVARLGAVLGSTAILAAPFIAWLFRAEAGLLVMALALGTGSFVLADALDATPGQIHRWLRLSIGVNLTLAVACVALAVWLLLR
jgi:hypothetical protein